MKPKKKKPTAAEVKEFWDDAEKPSTHSVARTMIAHGYATSQRMVARYKEMGWTEPGAPLNAHGRAVKTDKRLAKLTQTLPPEVVADLMARASDPGTIQSRVARMIDLYTCSKAANVATLQQSGIIAAILIAEEVVASLGHLILTDPGDVARLLHAITEATQGHPASDQVPGAGEVLDLKPVRSTETKDAVDRFRKSAGL